MCQVLAIEDEWLMADLVGRMAEQAGATLVDYANGESEATAAAENSRRAIILFGRPAEERHEALRCRDDTALHRPRARHLHNRHA